MAEKTGRLTGVTFGEIGEDEFGEYEYQEAPGTYTLTVTDLPEDMEWSVGMTVTIHPAQNPS